MAILTGARQTGNMTLARELVVVAWPEYSDLEAPACLARPEELKKAWPFNYYMQS